MADCGPPVCDRFLCPWPGCSRSFAELWRLKVHHRSPPDVRGSGRERGHGCELRHCPKCGKGLEAGRHHVGCAAGPVAPRQAAKRVRTAASAPPARPPPKAEPAMAPPPPTSHLETVAARLAAAVGDAGELVDAARALQASGGVPAGVLRQLSIALRHISEQQASALEEAASLLDSAAAARTLVDAVAGATPAPGAASPPAASPPAPRAVRMAELRALGQAVATLDDEAAAAVADADAAAAAAPPPSGGFTGFRVAPDLRGAAIK